MSLNMAQSHNYPCMSIDHDCFNMDQIDIGDVLVIIVEQADEETFAIDGLDHNVIVGLVTKITATSVHTAMVDLYLYANRDMQIEDKMTLSGKYIDKFKATYRHVLTVISFDGDEQSDELIIPPEAIQGFLQTYNAHITD